MSEDREVVAAAREFCTGACNNGTCLMEDSRRITFNHAVGNWYIAAQVDDLGGQEKASFAVKKLLEGTCIGLGQVAALIYEEGEI